MHVISQKRIRDAVEKWPRHAGALRAWYTLLKTGTFTTMAELRRTFGSVDKVGHVHVFNIAGNHLRLVASIHFNTAKVFIRYILTHKEYDKGHWKKLEGITS